MRLEDLLQDNKKQLEKQWKDSGVLEGLKPSGDTNMATLLESKPKQKIPENKFVSAGVFRLDRDDGIKYNAPIDAIIDDGGVSGDRSLADHFVQMEQDEMDRIISSSNNTIMPHYLLNDPEVVGYPDADMQREIYEWVAQDLPMWVVSLSVKDFGAGRGDFISAMPNNLKYIGFETKESLVLAGKRKYEGIELIHGDFFNSDIITDYTICIGTLNEDHGFDKWEYFNKILKHCINTTKIAIIFVLSSDMDGTEGFLDYPFSELFSQLPKDIRFTVDYTRLEDIYKLTVHIGGYND